MHRREFVKALVATPVVAHSPLWASSNKDYDVIVIGAGLAGLNTAYRLTQSGAKVLLLEASGRVGGRVQSLIDGDNAIELGGMQIGSGYGYTRTLVNEMGLSLTPLNNYVRSSDYLIQGELFKGNQWPKQVADQLTAEERQLPPAMLYYHYLKKAPKIDHAPDWTSPRYANLDVSMLSMLKKLGASDMAIQIIDANLNANGLATLSAADVLHTMAARSGGRGADTVIGGNEQLAVKLAEKNASNLILNKEVKSITEQENVTVSCRDGSQYVAKRCVVTVPFSVLRHIDIKAPVSLLKQQAIAKYNYTYVTQTHFRLTQPIDDGFSEALWSDTLFGRVFARKDNSGAVRHLSCWSNGAAAASLDRLKPGDAIDDVKQAMIKHRPALAGKIEPLHYHSWAKQPFAKGAYVHFSPGQVQRLVEVSSAVESKLHFAGEHTEFNYPGMESALVSSLRVSSELQQVL